MTKSKSQKHQSSLNWLQTAMYILTGNNKDKLLNTKLDNYLRSTMKIKMETTYVSANILIDLLSFWS